MSIQELKLKDETFFKSMIQGKKAYIPYLILIFLYLLGTVLIHRNSMREIENDAAYHTAAIVNYLWELNFRDVAQYLDLEVKNNHYKSIKVLDKTGKEVQVEVRGNPPSAIESFLIAIHLISTVERTNPVVRNGELLGYLSMIRYNMEIYYHALVLLILFISLFILYLTASLYRARNFLEEIVKQRTKDLNLEISNRKRIERDLRLTLNSLGEGVITTDLDNRIIRMNPIAQLLTGWHFPDAEGSPLELVYMKKASAREDDAEKPEGEGRFVIFGQNILISRTGDEFRISETRTPILSEKGETMGSVLIFRDISEEYKLHTQLEHSQRMDAIGQLAGGVAHDFNNMLGGIIGSAELLKNYLNDDPKAEEYYNLIIETSERAASLTGQLLTFSRKHKILSSQMNLHEVIEKSISLLKRTIDPIIEIKQNLLAESSSIIGDPTMLQSCLINLGINASHAMEKGGELYIETCNVFIDDAYCQNSSFPLHPGEHLQLLVEDNGCGIPMEKLPHIFEPFFTTKGQGRGTGLGLSTVYGSVTQHHGEIKVYSEIKKGTSFTLLFPVSESAEKIRVQEIKETLKGTGTILVVDDEEIMRLTAKGILESFGFQVVLAGNGKEALEIFQSNRDKIVLVLLDMVMPVMNGRDCFSKIREIAPQIPVILSSGFTNSDNIKQMKQEGLNGFISKPYRSYGLNKLLLQVLRESQYNPV